MSHSVGKRACVCVCVCVCVSVPLGVGRTSMTESPVVDGSAGSMSSLRTGGMSESINCISA